MAAVEDGEGTGWRRAVVRYVSDSSISLWGSQKPSSGGGGIGKEER